jgi:predicted TPR repeat methyltransferase
MAPRSKADELILERADRHHRAGELSEAKKAYDELLARQPNRSDVLYLRGLVALHMGDVEAVAFLERAVELEPTSVVYGVRLAHALRVAGRHDAALALLEPLVASHPDDANARAGLGRALAAIGETERALEHSRHAVELDASFANLTALAALLRRLGDDEDARVQLERAVDAASRHPVPKLDLATVLNNLGLVCETLGDHVAALRRYDQALELGGDRAVIESNRGNSLRAAGNLVNAEIAYRSAIAARPGFAAAHSNLGNVLRETGRAEEAELSYERAIELDPTYALPVSNLASLHNQRKDVERAIELYTKALALDPRLRTPYAALSWLFQHTGQVDRLPQLYAAWHEYLPEDPIARHMHVAAAGTESPDRPDAQYVATLFDDFAATFDDVLSKLDYRGAEVVVAAAIEALAGARVPAILDAGCGTGLCGNLLRPHADRLDGVDLSEGMLTRARVRDVYDELACADLVDFLRARPAAYDAIVAADVVVYFGDLSDLFASFAAAAVPGAVIAFTTETGPAGTRFKLTPTGRYCHEPSYVEASLRANGMTPSSQQAAVLRTEHGRAVESCVFVARLDARAPGG